MMLQKSPLFNSTDMVADAIELARIAEPPEGYYLAFSGGKDSCVVLDIAKRAGVKYEAHYNWTTVDPPELLAFIKQYHPEVTIHQPEKTMWQLIVENGPPTRQHRFCCKYLKEQGGEGRRILTGVRKAESFRRSKRKAVELCWNDPTRTFVNLILEWTNAELWQYIQFYNVPVCCLYGEGWARLGCIMCPNGNQKLQAKRWPKIAAAYRRAILKFYETHAHKHAEYAEKYGWKSGQDCWLWWMSGKSAKGDPAQRLLFE